MTRFLLLLLLAFGAARTEAQVLFSDDFTRATDPGPLAPWAQSASVWSVTGGALRGDSDSINAFRFAYVTNSWTDYSVQARIRFSSTNADMGGIGGRFSPGSGGHYAAWIAPEGSPDGPCTVQLLKVQYWLYPSWFAYEYTNVTWQPMQKVTVPSVGTNWHTLQITFQENQISVSYDGSKVITATDVESNPSLSGGIVAGMATASTLYSLFVDDVSVTALPPVLTAANDLYYITRNGSLTVPVPGVIGNDMAGPQTNLTAVKLSDPANGTLGVNSNGGFTYFPSFNFAGVDSFTYRASDGLSNSVPATVVIDVNTNNIFYDNFTRPSGVNTLAPWVVGLGEWNISGGVMLGSGTYTDYYSDAYVPTMVGDFTTQTRFQLPVGAWACGLSGRVNALTGQRYVLNVYPEGSPLPVGSNAAGYRLIKFHSWGTWSSSWQPMAQGGLPAVGTNWHTLKLAFYGNQIDVYFDGTKVVHAVDDNVDGLPFYRSGYFGAHMYMYSQYQATFDDVTVSALPGVNYPPVLPVQNDRTAAALTTLLVTNTATDLDIPTNTLTYALKTGPTNATIDTNGIISWTPTSAQAPSINVFTTVVTDYFPTATNSQHLSATNSFTVTAIVLDSQPPSVPTNLTATAVSSAQVNLAWSASSDNIGVAGYRVFRNGSLIATPGGTAYADTNLAAATTYSYAVAAFDAAGNVSAASASVLATTPPLDTNAPAVVLTAPANGATVTGMFTISANATDNVAVAGVQFKVDGANLGAEVTALPYQTVWNSAAATNGTHTLAATARDAAGNNTTASVTVTVTNNSISQGLAAYWTFDEGAGAAAADSSGNGYNMSLVNGPTWTTGKFNGALSFNGTNNYGLATAINPGATAAVSVSLWLKRTYTNLSSGNTVLFESSANFNSSTTGFTFFPDDQCGGMAVGLHGNSGYNINCYNQPSSGVWHHLVAIYDKTQNAANEVTLYVDGALQTARSQIYSADNNNAFGANPLYLMSRGGTQLFTSGTIDDFRIYGRALSAAEAAQLYSLGTTIHNGPTLSNLSSATVAEMTLLQVTNTASDNDIPPLTLTYQLLNPPSGATIGTNSGVISWTPTEAQGPGTNTLTTVVTDNGSPPLSATNAFAVVVQEMNQPPVLPTQTNRTIVALSSVTVTNTATDPDIPTNTLGYVLQSGPTNALISTNGIITWTPIVAQVPSVQTFTTVVTDTNPWAVNSQHLSATNSFPVTVNALHNGPTLSNPTNVTVVELTLLQVTNTASDSDIPPRALTYQLVNSPTNATINTNGLISWTPTEAQGPGTNTLTTVVTDDGSPALSATNLLTLVVQESNQPPVLPGQTNRTLTGLSALMVTNTATDPDIPANTLGYVLQSGPTNASISTNGIITWTPVVAQVPSVQTFTTVVTDTNPWAVNSQHLSATNSFTVTVNAVHNGPTLPNQTNVTVVETTLLQVTNTASDSDIPSRALTYQLVNSPTNATIDANSGVISWTPTEAQGPGTNTLTTIVTDDGSPPLSATNFFTVVVQESNQPPVLPGQTNRTLTGLSSLTVTNTATDPDIPANTLGYALQGGPTNALISPNGIITWTPVVSQVPSVQTFTTVVTDTNPWAVNPQHLSATNSFTVTVNAVHNGPTLPNQTNVTVLEMTLLQITNTASDSDIPPHALTYQLVNSPINATIDTNGLISWAPTEAQGPGTNTLTTVVTDDDTPALSVTNFFTVVVQESNQPPVLPTQTDRTLTGLSPLTVTNTATDPDIPANILGYVLQSGPTNALISTNGIITWTPIVAQVPSVQTFTTVVTDTNPWAVNSQHLSATNSFTVTVNAVHNGPTLPNPTNVTVVEMTLLQVTNTASDSDIPPHALTYQLVNSPTNAVIDTTNGVISWTPTEAQGPGTNTLTTVVTDDGSPALSATNFFTVVVQESNQPPVLPAQTDRTLTGLSPLTVTNTATDPDIPTNTLGYVLESGPTNALISTNGIITWTPIVAQVPSVQTFTTVVTDTNPWAVNSQHLSVTNSFTVAVEAIRAPPVLPNQPDQVIAEPVTLLVTNTATAEDVPALPLAYQLTAAPAGAVIDTNGVIAWTPAPHQAGSTNLFQTSVTDDPNGSGLTATNSFTVVVQPLPIAPSPVFLSIALSQNLATLRWNTVTGRTYRLEYNEDLASTDWTNLSPNMLATDLSLSITNNRGVSTQRFYRVLLLP